ncbi:MAG: hypothetical protein LQ342_007963 [Letrouitia transgressa]|nr:MAG: hypothetical protein LQ342_007963 [Letrouitia transgressa]
MAEALVGIGVAANVLQLVTAGYQLLERINTFQSRTKDIPAAFRELSIQLPLMIDTCESISKEDHAIDTSSFREVVKGCFEHVQSLDSLLSKILPTDQDSRVARTWKAIGSVKIEKKIVEYQRVLEIYKTALILHVGRRNSHIPQSQVQSSVPALSLQRDTCYSYPSSQISQFIGREHLLGRVDNALLTPEANPRRPKVAVLLGMGGQGKTALALEYCRRAQSRAYFKSVLWVDAASPATVAQSFENLADHLTKRQRAFKDFNACLEFVKDTIETWAAPWMVVFDNFDQPSNIPNIMDHVPNACNGAVLVTSRHADSGALGSVLEMNSMEEDESIELLLNRTHDLPSFQNVEGARLVVRTLGCLPLAIEQAGAYIRARKISFPAFLDHFNNRRAKVLQHTPDLWDYRKKVDDQKNTTSLSVFTTWELSFQQLAHDNEQKTSMGHFMTLLGFFHNLEIREGLFKAYFHRSNPAPPWMNIFTTDSDWDTYNYEDTVVNLSQLSLLQHTRPGDHSGCQISLHPLIRDWTQYRLKPEDRRAYTIEAMSVTKRYIAQNEAEIENWSLQTTREVLTHIDVCVENYSRFCPAQSQSLSEELRECLTKFGLFYTRHGRYQHGEDILNCVLRKDEVCFGPKHVKTLETKLYISDVLLGLGRYYDVEELLQEILPKSKKLPNTARARIFCNLAKAAFKQGQYPKALELYRSALQNQEQFLTLGHPDLLNTYEALAQVYRNQGRNGKAIALYSKTLDSYVKLHGMNHPDTFSTMNNLGNCYRNLAKFDEADKIYHDALCGNEKFLGSDHPNTLNNMVNLAINHLYRYQYEEAEELFTRALATYQNKLGPEHPETLRTNLNLASLYLARGHCEEACSMLRQVFEGRLKRLGVHSDYTLYAIERLLSALWLNGQCKEADTHATHMLNMQGDLRSANTYSDAELAILRQDFPFTAVEVIFTRTLARRKSNLVWTHNDITDLNRSLAFVYLAQKRYKMTEDTLLQIIHAHETRCGPQHELTLRAKLDLSEFREKGTSVNEVEKASGSCSMKSDTLFESQQESQASIIDSSEQNRNLDFIQASMSTLGLP